MIHMSTWTETVQDAMPFFIVALFDDRKILERRAGKKDSEAIGLAFANFARMEKFWCNCTEKHDRFFWMSPTDASFGLMCGNCRGTVSRNEHE